MLFPKPNKADRKDLQPATKDQRRNVKEEAKRLDGGCMYQDCPCRLGYIPFGNIISVHHIKPLSAGGEDTVENLITLCALAHYWAENGKTNSDGSRMSGRDFVATQVLKPHIGTPQFRWVRALEYLENIIGVSVMDAHKADILRNTKSMVKIIYTALQKEYPNYEGSHEASQLDPIFSDLIDEMESLKNLNKN